MTSVEQRLRAANPVLDPETAMDEPTYAAMRERLRPKVIRRGWRHDVLGPRQRWQLTALCVLLALAVGAGSLWGRARPDNLIAAESPTVRIARAYVDARNDRDATAALALLSPEATVVEFPVIRGVAELPAAFEYLDLVDERVTVVACDPSQDAPEVVVCSYEMTNRLVEQTVTASIPGELRVTVDNGRIIGIENAIDSEIYESAVIRPWFEWLGTRYDTGEASLYRWVFQLGRIVPTPRSDALAEIGNALDDYTRAS